VTAQGPGGTGPGDNQQPDSQAHGGDWPADELAARRRMHARFWQGLVLPDVGVLLVELFVHQTCMLGAGYEVPIAELHEAYVAWCKASGREAETAQGFARDLKAASPQLSTGRAVVPDGRARTWRGVRLRTGAPSAPCLR